MIQENQQSEVRQSLETCLPTGVILPSTGVGTQPEYDGGQDDDSSATTDDQSQEVSRSVPADGGRSSGGGLITLTRGC